MADILGGVLEIAANIAITAVATAAIVAATGITVVTGGLGCFVLGAVVGITMKVGGTLREGRYVPFGPFLVGAGLTAMVAGPKAILDTVLRGFGL